MANMTLRLPDELHQRLRRHRHIKWTQIVREALEEKVSQLESGGPPTAASGSHDIMRHFGIESDLSPAEVRATERERRWLRESARRRLRALEKAQR